MQGKKILVTGGTGYIGSHTIIELITQGYSVVCVDNCINSDKSSLKSIHQITGVNVPFFQVDLCDSFETKKIFTAHP